MQNPATLEIFTKSRDFLIGKLDVAVSRDMQERIVPELVVGEPHTCFRPVDLERSALANRREKIRETGRIRVPVATPVVLKARDRERRRRGGGAHYREPPGGIRMRA